MRRRILLILAVLLVVVAMVVGIVVFGDSRWWWAVAALVAILAVLSWLLYRVLRWPWGSPWRDRVLASGDALLFELDALRPPGAMGDERELRDSVAKAVRCHVEAARAAARPPADDQRRRQRLPLGVQVIDWWTGAACEAAYVNLHEAEVALARVLPDDQIEARIPEALARLETMDATDPRRRAAEAQLAPDSPTEQRRAAFQSAVRIGLELKDQQYMRLRSFRNVVLITSFGLTILVLAVCLVGALRPDALPLCFGPAPTATNGVPPPVQGPPGVACPSEERPPTPGTVSRRLPAPGDVTLVAVLGMLGGALSAAIAIRHLQGTSTPYDVPIALSLLKLPSGAVSALVGLLFVRGGFVPGLSQLDSQPQILAYAFLFGVAQQLVTRLVDQRAQDILTKVPSKEPVNTKPEPPHQ